MEDKVGISGHINYVLKDENGNIKEEGSMPNLITTAGKAFIADQLSTTPGSTKMTHMAIGTGTQAAAITDTTLAVANGAELDRNAVTSSTDSGAVLTVVGDWAAGDGTGAVTEAGIFNASSNGTLLCHSVFSAINKAAGDTLSLSWAITIA